MAHALAPDKELYQLTARSNVELDQTIQALMYAKFEHEDEAVIQAKLRLQLSQVLALSSLLGRRRTLLQAQAKSRGKKLTAALERAPFDHTFLAETVVSPFVPFVEFQEAIDDMLERYPKLAPGYERVQKEYARGHAFALAKSTDRVVTQKVQGILAKSIRTGAPQHKTTQLIENLGGWSRAYADVVYETNAASAYSAGVVAQAYDPEVEEVAPAMTVIGPTQSPPSRKNHVACVGLIAGTKDTIWHKYSTPLGYRCRHSMNLVDRWELKSRGLLTKTGQVLKWLPANFRMGGPDPGFGHGNLPTRLGFVS